MLRANEDIFFDFLDRGKTESLVDDSLIGCDDGQLFLEYREKESFIFSDSKLKHSSFSTDSGFSLNAVIGDRSVFSHASGLSEEELALAHRRVVSAIGSGSGDYNIGDKSVLNRRFYTSDNPLSSPSFAEKIDILGQIDSYARAKDERVKEVKISLNGEFQIIRIIRAGSESHYDIRPLVRLAVEVTLSHKGRQEVGFSGAGGRCGYEEYIGSGCWRKTVDKALRMGLVNLDAKPSPAGEMSVVLGSGWPGIMLHEAVGHGLEGDFNRKKSSVFHNLLGEKIASKGVTVVDDGTLHARRGSLNIDDEGQAGQYTVLIEDGKLKAFMQDRLNGRLMNSVSTGNGRRQGYAHAVMPRMTNTYMLGGDYSRQELIAAVKSGIYAVNFSSGQVDVTSGKFVFSTSEAYLIEDGKITSPIKGAALIGSGSDALTKISMIGNDLELDGGIGTCGKNGQLVPVGVGQPCLLIEGITVGGSDI